MVKREISKKNISLLLLYLVVFFIPFESIGEREIIFTIPRILEFLLFASAILAHKNIMTNLSAISFCFWGYIFFFVVSALLNGWPDLSVVISQFSTWVAMVFLMLVVQKIVDSEKVIENVVTVIMLSCSLLAFFSFIGLAATERSQGNTIRVTLLNENENTAGGILAIGLVASTYHILRFKSFFAKLTIYLFQVLMISGIMRTGSRGALIAAAVGYVVLALFSVKKSKWDQKIFFASAIIVGIIILLNSELMLFRFRFLLDSGDAAGRENTFPEAVRMISEKPFLGWGPENFAYELGSRQNILLMGPHNLILWTILETGFFGALLFWSGVLKIAHRVWENRVARMAPIVISLLLTAFTINMNIGWHHRKYTWVILGLGIALGNLRGEDK